MNESNPTTINIQVPSNKLDGRKQRGLTIAEKPEKQISQIDCATYRVHSQSGNGDYTVFVSEDEWHCECPDHQYRGVKCKHIWAVEFSLKMKEQVKKNIVIQEVIVSKCVFCHSPNIKKFGVRHNKSGDIQRFVCQDCRKTFSVNIGFERMKHDPKAITAAMQLYFSGESLRNTMQSLKLLGVEVSHQTVYNWIKKYVRLMRDYAEKIVPNVSDTWRADEVYVKVKGNLKYLFAIMDDETRFLIAQEVAETKDKHDARMLFMRVKRLMEKQPKTLITDGLQSYSKACEYAFDGAEHIREIRLSGKVHNNKMERLNGEIRDREKTMRGLKRRRTVMLTGYQLFHNYIRPHEALNGQTPSEACGIKIEGQNKWKTLIQNASQQANTDIV